MIIWVQIFGGARTVKIWERKKRPKFAAISDNFKLRSWIVSYQDIDGRYRLQSIPRSTEKKSINFGPQTKKVSAANEHIYSSKDRNR